MEARNKTSGTRRRTKRTKSRKAAELAEVKECFTQFTQERRIAHIALRRFFGKWRRSWARSLMSFKQKMMVHEPPPEEREVSAVSHNYPEAFEYHFSTRQEIKAKREPKFHRPKERISQVLVPPVRAMSPVKGSKDNSTMDLLNYADAILARQRSVLRISKERCSFDDSDSDSESNAVPPQAVSFDQSEDEFMMRVPRSPMNNGSVSGTSDDLEIMHPLYIPATLGFQRRTQYTPSPVSKRKRDEMDLYDMYSSDGETFFASVGRVRRKD